MIAILLQNAVANGNDNLEIFNCKGKLFIMIMINTTMRLKNELMIMIYAIPRYVFGKDAHNQKGLLILCRKFIEL